MKYYWKMLVNISFDFLFKVYRWCTMWFKKKKKKQSWEFSKFLSCEKEQNYTTRLHSGFTTCLCHWRFPFLYDCPLKFLLKRTEAIRVENFAIEFRKKKNANVFCSSVVQLFVCNIQLKYLFYFLTYTVFLIYHYMYYIYKRYTCYTSGLFLFTF